MDVGDLGSVVDRPISAKGPTVRELATGERARDWPLEMSYGYPSSVFKKLGWHHRMLSKRRVVIRCIAANLVMAAKCSPTGQVSISLSKKFYGDPRRYRHTLLTYDLVKSAVEWMEVQGLLTKDKAVGFAPNDPRATHLQTTIRATQKLLKPLWKLPLSRVDDDFDSIRMRDERGVRIKITETEETAAMRARMARVNTMTTGIRIVMPSSCTEIAPKFWRCPAKRKGEFAFVHLDDLRCYRMFNRESWTANGRLYGPWQSIPKKIREKIRFLAPDGTEIETIERDYPSHHAVMLYARRGHVLDHKPYDVEAMSGKRFSKTHGKIALLTMVNARGHRDATGAVKVSFEDEGMTFPGAGELIGMVKALNPIIAEDFHSDAGMGLMHDDSEIALAVIEDMIGQGIDVLPIHDSFIVAKQHETALQTAMDKALADYVARVWPKGDDAVSEISDESSSPVSGDCQDTVISSGDAPQMIGHLSPAGRPAPGVLPAASSQISAAPVLPEPDDDALPVYDDVERLYRLLHGVNWADRAREADEEEMRRRAFRLVGPYSIIPTLDELRRFRSWSALRRSLDRPRIVLPAPPPTPGFVPFHLRPRSASGVETNRAAA